MERTIYSSLLAWKKSPSRKPLVLNGARQVGKTWILKEFGTKEYKNLVYFNCDGNKTIEQVFQDGFQMKSIIMNLGAIAGQEIFPGETLIVFDEIQEVPSVLTALKYFAEDVPEYHVAAAGSLLGLALHEGTGFPVGKVDILNLYPMSFDEFVLAVQGKQLSDILHSSNLESFAPLDTKFVEILRLYYFTGGMPEAVDAYVHGKSTQDIRNIQKAILYAYGKDISKHAEPGIVQKIHQVWDSIPQQLAKENKRFIYGALRHGARAKEYETAIQWLIDAGLVYKVQRVRKAGIPLKFHEDTEAFKLFLLDCGLMGVLSDAPPEQILIGNSIFEEYKGAFTEQYVVEQLKAQEAAKGLSIFYFSADDSKQELDFLLQEGSELIPIEVKAEENLRSKSLRQFVLDHPSVHGIRFSMSPYRTQDWMTNIPLYAVCRI